MSSLLPFLFSPQNTSSVSDSGGISTESSAHVKKDQATPFPHTVSPAFAQVLREHHERPSLQNTINTLAPSDGQADDAQLSFLTQNELESLQEVIGSDSLETFLRESQLYGLQTRASQELATQPPNSLDGVPDPSRVLRTTVYDDTIADDQLKNIQQLPPVGTASTIAHTPLAESRVLVNALVQRQAFQSTNREHASGVVSQTSAINPLVSKSVGAIPQASVSQVSEVGPSSSHDAQSPVVKLATFLPNQGGEQGIRTLTRTGKEAPVALPQTNSVIQQTEPLKFSNQPSQTNLTIDLHHVRQNIVPLAPHVQPTGPAGFAQTDSISQLVVKPIAGSGSIVNDLSSSVIENRTTLQIDPLGDTGLHNKGDRSQSVIETSTKIVGLDTSGGPGLGSGMNYPQNSQTGYQHASTTTGQAMGMRGLEERIAEFPTPALQRLQMDVQLSETQRVSIDVGVQNRQVYAGLVTDHAVLRTLASQFVPQLENQLADVDLELQEFSAEVREERQQQDDSVFRHPSLTGQGTRHVSQQESVAPQSSLNRQEHAGLHLVA